MDSNPPPPDDGGESTDKRRDLRVPLRILKIEATDQQKKEIFFGYAGNISTSGLFIQTPSPREPGTRFRLKFSLSKKPEETVICLTEVVWIRNYAGKGTTPGMGLKFVEITPESLRLIEQFVENKT